MKLTQQLMARLCMPLGTGLFMALMSGCGGGSSGAIASATPGTATVAVSSAEESGSSTARALAAAQLGGSVNVTAPPTAVAAHQAPTVVRLEQTSATRVSRTTYDYVFALHVKGSGVHIQNGVFTGTTTGVGSQVIDGQAKAASLNAGRDYVIEDTITVRHDRTYPFDPAKLVFAFAGTLVDTAAPASGVQIGAASFYVAGGRPGHEGYFESSSSEPLAGQEIQLNVVVRGAPTAVVYQLQDSAGNVFREAPMARPWPERYDYTAMVSVPPQPFKIKITAIGVGGASVTWVSDAFVPREITATFVPKRGAVFRRGEAIEGLLLIAPIRNAAGARVSLLLPTGFTAERTNWQVPAGISVTQIPVVVLTPASVPNSSFYDFAVAISVGTGSMRTISTTQLLGR